MEKKVWFITGISSGLGEAIANKVMESGDFVIGTFRKQEQVQAFNGKNSGKGRAVLLDVTDYATMEKLVSEIAAIDVLVNNAGMGFVGAIEESSLKEVRAVFEANFFGVLKLTQLVLPKMRAQSSGHIVQISSHGGFKAFAGFGIYNASKFALEGFSEALAQEVQPLGIKTIIVEPGPFRTNFAASGLGEAKNIIDDYNQTAGNFRNRLKGVNGKQEGHPEKAALAIINAVNSENNTLRLPLGKIPLSTMKMKLDSVLNDLEANRKIAEAAVFD
ncbi:oxidoreductase [Croceivirga thetidis]|uniref:SDR family NAD(P)-dependent oxidoreductase n=1 Tax=Croceivirga thetidis TaxID=2721623 RepID=A0ABX1GPM4_9FLAO|nr:oxidoreductase [Croceivirga thetidis]NKI31574.1 SDR family NAD(P)-dependent oxidoreductase [Croceivirga thetidis]